MHLERSIQQPIMEFVDMDHRWRGPDAGLIWCWERGRQKAVEDPALAVMARKEVLVPLAFKERCCMDHPEGCLIIALLHGSGRRWNSPFPKR